MYMMTYVQSLTEMYLFVFAAFIVMLSNISLGSWNPICGEKFLFRHLNIGGALNNPSTFCQIQGQ